MGSQQPMIGPQMPGRGMNPSSNNAPLQFNHNKGKAPMPIVMEGGNRNDSAVSSSMSGPSNSDNDNMMMGGGPGGYYPPMGGPMGGPGPMSGGPMGNPMGGGPMGGPMGGGPMGGGPMGGYGNNSMGGPMMGQDPNMMMQMFNQYGWGSMGPGMGQALMSFMPKEIMRLKSSVLYPPPPGAPPPTTRERPPGCRTIFVGGLPENATEEMVREVFENVGGIVSLRKGKKNFAHIRFETEDCVDRALHFSGYRMKLEDKDDKPNTGRLHVDFASARDDQYEFECKQRALVREMRHVQRLEEDRLRPPSPPPVVHFSEHEALTLLEKLKTDEEFITANSVLVAWMERGDLTRRNVSSFYSLVQCSNAQVRRLLLEKTQLEEEVELAKQRFRGAWESIIQQLGQIEKVFTATRKQKNWDHFSKAQRKNIELWHKQLQEIKQQQQEEFLSERVEDEMEMSDNDNEADVSTSTNKRKKYDEGTLLQQQQQYIQENQLSILKDENDSLKCQVEAFKNELELIKQENKNATSGKDNQVKMLTQVLQGMQQQLLQAKQQVQELKREKQRAVTAAKATDKDQSADKEKGDTEKDQDADKDEDTEKGKSEAADDGTSSPNDTTPTKDSTIGFSSVSSSELSITDLEARLIGLVSCFLHVHPNGASADYIWSYLNQLGVHVRTSQIEDLLERLPSLFKLELSGVGASIERKWQYLGFHISSLSFLSM